MIKKLIAPLQKLLMQKRICPACTRPLNKAKILSKLIGSEDKIVACKCGRIFVFDSKSYTYRRATEEDMQKIKTPTLG